MLADGAEEARETEELCVCVCVCVCACVYICTGMFSYTDIQPTQFGEYVRVGVTWKSCDFLPQPCSTMLHNHVNKFNPFVNVVFLTMTKDISA